MGGGYKADTTPLLKALLHGAKFPSCSVNGVLLGFDGGDADGVHVVDAVPLFHTALPLAPHLEVALAMVDAYVKAQQGGLQIVGYYQADAAYGVTELGKTGKAIADRLHQQTKASCALLIDSKKLAAMVNEKEDLPFELVVRRPNGWQVAKVDKDGNGGLVCTGGSVRDLLLNYWNAQKHHKICDFDEHLDDITKDFLNPDLLA